MVRRLVGHGVFWLGRFVHVLLGVGKTCRFEPTCSSFAREALVKHGLAKGTWLLVRRLMKCHPWGGYGWDPVP